ncbi:myotubularin-related protein 12 [Gadus chalcogrammus]|uniref:myotubularin-related protein 12 n=1 Tax=Gadus chalcogrammus TaxID=1042646 RepID=UPI0024C4C3B3|nr:myotubularin-related protein 12 [Gadus chalcogrammus]
MSALGAACGKGAKASFVSYVIPEEIKAEKDFGKQDKTPTLLPGEVVFCGASKVLRYRQDDVSQHGLFGTLVCTNFRLAFVSDQDPSEELENLFRNKMYGEDDIPLACVDNIYGVYEDKRKLITGGMVKNKIPSKLVIHCKDLRVFQFTLTYCLGEEAKRIFQGITHHCLEPKSLRNLFAFSFCELNSFPEMKRQQKTLMFEVLDDWAQDMNRLRGACRLVDENAEFGLSPSLPQFFIVPSNVSEADLNPFQGHGLPMWCWSHPSGCALFKTSALPAAVLQEDPVAQAYMEKMLTAVAHNYLFSVKTEDLSDTLPSVTDIQLAYNKFKHFFLIENTTDFWVSDVKWLSSLDGCGWLDIVRQCLQKAMEVVECLEKENANVLIMEEGGSDLCCVISSLAQLMLDPFYRTLTGFQSLVQKEWVAGGHRFMERLNQLHLKDKEEVSPVFLLFLEGVMVLLSQYGPSFQFTETYLTVLSDSLHLPVFSTFLFNSQHHRHIYTQAESPHSPGSVRRCPVVWDWSVQFDCKAQELFINPLYTEKSRTQRASQRSQLHKHQRHLSLPGSGFKLSPKRGFFKDEADSLKKILRVKRLSRWMLSPEPGSSSSRDFYQAWQCRPLDYHGLLLPCVDGPWLRLWMQRYLRWVQEVQIFGGGLVTVLSRVYGLLEEVNALRRELDHRGGAGRSAARPQRPRAPGGEAPGPQVRLSSSFPFSGLRSSSSYKPSIPDSLLHGLGPSGGLGEGGEELDDAGSVV